MHRIGQLIGLLAINSYYRVGLGEIYQGSLKVCPAPALNCYSCPFASFACPIGSLQHYVAIRAFPYYVIGTIALVGVIVGRAACGWFCPFGLIQDLLYKIRTWKLRLPRWATSIRFYLLVAILVVVYFAGHPYFCSLICPAGTLEAGVPLVSGDEELAALTGWLFYLKFGLALLFLGFTVLVKRPFCRVICPLGALYALFNRWSIIRLRIEPDRCTQCGLCQKACPMDIRPYEGSNMTDCIRCFRCGTVCPHQVISMTGPLGDRVERLPDPAPRPPALSTPVRSAGA